MKAAVFIVSIKIRKLWEILAQSGGWCSWSVHE